MNKKRIGLLILLICLVAAAGYFLKKYNENISQLKSANEDEKQIHLSKKLSDKKAVEKNTSKKIEKRIKFKSKDEIREEYGKLEIVALYNGREFTGAVISIDEFYTMITLEGLIKIPMGDVKSRVIIK